MSQRCGYCGKTRKQHFGKACIDVEGFKRALDYCDPTNDGLEINVIGFFRNWPNGSDLEARICWGLV